MTATKEFYEIIRDLRQLEARYGEDCLEIIENALKKQIPQKPCFVSSYYKEGMQELDIVQCPQCAAKYGFDNDVYDYCMNCGQRIDWSDEE